MNILLFVPIAWGDLRGRMFVMTVMTVVSAALLSGVIETLQMWIPGRVSTLNDGLANVFGWLCGVCAIAIFVGTGGIKL